MSIKSHIYRNTPELTVKYFVAFGEDESRQIIQNAKRWPWLVVSFIETKIVSVGVSRDIEQMILMAKNPEQFLNFTYIGDNLKTDLLQPITTSDDAKKYITELVNNDEVYHPEDDAFDIIWDKIKPTNEELLLLNHNMEMVYKFANFDPCELILELKNAK